MEKGREGGIAHAPGEGKYDATRCINGDRSMGPIIGKYCNHANICGKKFLWRGGGV